MSRAGLSPDVITLEAAELADADGLRQVSLSAVAVRLGVRAPSLSSHAAGAEDLHGRLTLLALTDLADRGNTALAGLAGQDAYVRWRPSTGATRRSIPAVPENRRTSRRSCETSAKSVRAFGLGRGGRGHTPRQ